MKISPCTPVKLEDPIGAGYEGKSRYKVKDNYPYTVIPRVPGFQIGKFKFPDQELIAIRCIANDKVRLYRNYFKYFLEKVNNILAERKADWHVVGRISPSFDYTVVSLKNIDADDAQVFESAKDTMLILMDQYRNHVYRTEEYTDVERATLDPAVKSLFKCKYNRWILFIPSTLEFVSLSDKSFRSLFDIRDAEMDDIYSELKYEVKFTDMQGNSLENCVPVDLSGSNFNIRVGLECCFSISTNIDPALAIGTDDPSTIEVLVNQYDESLHAGINDGHYEVNAVYDEEGNKIIPNDSGVYSIGRVTKDRVIKVDLAYGEFSLEYKAINCVLANIPKLINRNTEYDLAFAVLGKNYEVTDFETENCVAAIDAKNKVLTLSEVTGDAKLLVKAHEMIDMNLPEGEHFTAEVSEGYKIHTKMFHPFKFKVNAEEGYRIKEVSFIMLPPMPEMPTEITVPIHHDKCISTPHIHYHKMDEGKVIPEKHHHSHHHHHIERKTILFPDKDGEYCMIPFGRVLFKVVTEEVTEDQP